MSIYRKSWWLVLGVFLVLIITGALFMRPAADQPPVTALALQRESSPSNATTAPHTIAASRQNALTQAIANVGPSVVGIEVRSRVRTGGSLEDLFRQFFGSPNDSEPDQPERFAQGFGSGFVVNYNQHEYILTNHHVIENADQITIVLNNGRKVEAKVVGSDAEMDVAVLEASKPLGLNPLELGNSDQLIIGEWAIAIGNPEGLQNTVTVGVVSATKRRIPKGDGNGVFSDLIQTDAAINPGNSGGPLVNAEGKVIGINTMIIRRSANGIPLEGLNFAIAINGVKIILSQLVAQGFVTRAWLGVSVQDLNAELAESLGLSSEQKGALIADLVPSSPALKAGLRSGDIITKVNNQIITGASDLQQAIAFRQPGERVRVEIVRDKKTLTVEVALEARETTATASASIVEKFGITVQEMTSELAGKLGVAPNSGVVIVNVEPRSRAAGAGLRPNDVIVQVNRQPVRSVADWNRVASSLRESDAVMLAVRRGASVRFVVLR